MLGKVFVLLIGNRVVVMGFWRFSGVFWLVLWVCIQKF
jgi:hypothetical protein